MSHMSFRLVTNYIQIYKLGDLGWPWTA